MCSKSSSEATIQVKRYLMNVCSKVQNLKERFRGDIKSFCRIQRFDFFWESSINNDLSRWARLLEYIGIIKSLSRVSVHVCVCVYLSVYMYFVLWRWVLSRMINYICDMKKFCSDAR